MGGGGNPPVVTLIEPEDPDVGDPVGAERMFTAECDQPATLTFYLNGDPVHTSDPGVQQASYTFPSAPLGQHMVRVVAANENGTGENYWTWNVFDADTPIGSCGPAQEVKPNAVAKLNSAELYQRSNGTRYVTVGWYVGGCYAYSKEFTATRCELSTTIKVSWSGGSNEIVKPVYTDYCIQSGTDNIEVSSSASSYSVEVKMHTECWVWVVVWTNIGREDASASCVIHV
ncbi:hypothetical protein [Methanoculleus sp.]|uniref:hypothetical protein n=1 Tax=Methanoculleus sp. TaxID=90427 RepID=UPI00272E6D40|nr:hypothetical protein [Methanoculleus sp.]